MNFENDHSSYRELTNLVFYRLVYINKEPIFRNIDTFILTHIFNTFIHPDVTAAKNILLILKASKLVAYESAYIHGIINITNKI